MARKRIYRAINVNDVNLNSLKKKFIGAPLVGVDVAKTEFFAALMNGEQQVVKTVKWVHPEQTPDFVGLLVDLGATEVAMEPSGTYGDVVRLGLLNAGLAVFRVSPKRSHDMAEVYDGVPSLHDGKSSAIVAKLHADGRSEPWPIRGDHERRLAASLRILELHSKVFRQNRNRLANLLARHWPELPEILELRSASLLELLAEYGSPEAVAKHPAAAAKLLKKTGGYWLAQEKVDAAVGCAETSLGVPMLEAERDLIRVIAGEARRAQKLLNKAKREVERLTEDMPATRDMSKLVGKTTSAVLVAAIGDPANYACAEAYLKSLGLNVKEKSSGQYKGRLKITKRGPGVARQFLFMAALRLIDSDPIVRAWYDKKVRRDGGRLKIKAVVAVMRKMTKALWHVAQGKVFDASLLFDVKRLELAS